MVEADAIHWRCQGRISDWQGSVRPDLFASSLIVHIEYHRFGNRYFENRNPEEEIPGKQGTGLSLEMRTDGSVFEGRHRWVDFAQVNQTSFARQ